MEQNNRPETPSSPRLRSGTPKKPDKPERLRAGSIPAAMVEMRLPLSPIMNGALTNGHESAGPPEYYAHVDLDSPAPKSPWANGTVLANGQEQTEATISQPERVVRSTSPPTVEGARVEEDELRPVQSLPPPRTRWAKIKEDTKAKQTLRQWRGNSPLSGDHLCKACEALDLSVDKFVLDPNAPRHSNVSPNFWGKRRMGTFEEIEGHHNCPLCRLLVQAASSEDRSATVETGARPDSHFKIGGVPQPECYLYWTVDGRERVKESKGDRIRTIKRTRRLCIEWTHRPHDRAFIVLVAPEGKFTTDGRITNGKWEQSTLFLGRLLTSIHQSSIDLIKTWLNICVENHKEECQVHNDLEKRFNLDVRYQSATFTVIDVVDMCLTSLPDEPDEDGKMPDAKYIALSYTWGEETRISGGHGVPAKSKVMAETLFKTTTKNIQDLELKDGIRHALKQNMPKAIQNAIYLTQKLGYRYLWVDSLCIVQDDSNSWELNAEIMDVVYGNAEFTICAADGDSASDGLKALFPPEDSRYARHAEEFVADYQIESRQRLQLILSRPSESYIVNSRWNRRAWTFQERMLSRRCLIFVAGRMYFQCRSTTMSEDIYSEAAVAGWSVELHGAPARTLQRLETDPVSVYKKCLGMYTERKLSYEKDVLAAFSGIANIIHGSLGPNCEPIFGLPNSHFDWALLWEPEERPEAREPGRFPTWSWCGWKGKRITYKPETVAGPEINLHEWLLQHTWITYYIRDGTGKLRLIWNPHRHSSSTGIEERWKGYDSPKTGLPRGSDPDGYPEYDWHGRPFSREALRMGRMADGVPKKQFSRTVGTYRRRVAVIKPETEEDSNKGNPYKFRVNQRYLQFWTWSAEFYLGEETPNDKFSDGSKVGNGLKRFAILDAEGDFAGTCILDESWIDAARKRKRQQFIALSDARDFDASEYGCWNFYSEDERDIVPWQLYNVMMIWYEEGNTDVAYRGGIGKVYKSAFGNGADDGWKEIVLG